MVHQQSKSTNQSIGFTKKLIDKAQRMKVTIGEGRQDWIGFTHYVDIYLANKITSMELARPPF